MPSIMMAHILFPQIDELPASLSGRWVQDVLRRKLGFEGAIFTDDLSMGGAAACGGYRERAIQALDAGCDMLPVCNERPGVIEILDNLTLHRGAKTSDGRLVQLRTRHESGQGRLQENPQWQQARKALDIFNV